MTEKAIDVTMVTLAIRAVQEISAEHSQAIDIHPYPSFDQFKAAARSAEAKLSDYGFRITDDYRGAYISLHGIRSGSTAGIGGAMTNWLRAAEKKIGDAA